MKVATALSVVIGMACVSTSYAQGESQVAQACGWYAISHCSKNYNAALNAQERWGGGFVVDTDDADYPNFAGGYFCHVVGPKDYEAAEITAKRMRRGGFRSAYFKSAC